MKNLIILSNTTGIQDMLMGPFFIIAVIIFFFLIYGSKNILALPTKSNKDEKIDLVDFCAQELREFKFSNSEEVTQAIIKHEMVTCYCAYTSEPVIVNSLPKLGEKVFKKLSKECK